MTSQQHLPERHQLDAAPGTARVTILRRLWLLLAGKHRRVLSIGVLASVGTLALLVEPWIYSVIVDDITGVLVAEEPGTFADFVLGGALGALQSAVESSLRMLRFPLYASAELSARSIADALSTLLAGAVLMVLVRVVANVAEFFADVASVRLAADVERRYTVDTYRHVLRLPLRFFARRATGKIARQVDQTDQVSPIVSAFAQEIWPDAFLLVAILVVVSIANIQLAMVALLAVPVYAWLSLHVTRMIDAGIDAYYTEWEDVSAHIHETIAGIKTVRAFGAEARETARLDANLAQGYAAYVDRERLIRRYAIFQQLVITLSKAGIAGLGGWMALDHQLTPGAVVMFLAYVEHLYAPIERLTGLFSSLQQHVASVKRAERLRAEEPETGHERPPFTPSAGAIVLDGVSFAYEQREVLHNITLQVAAGERLAIVGPSGAGKTTLLDLVAGQLAPTKGHILIDGQVLNRVSPASVRAAVRGVAVDGTVFRGSVADNIRYGRPEATDEEVVDAARLAELEAVIARLPEGYATTVGERGVQLSAGERQRLLIARAFCARPTVLIVDEALSNLDFRTAAAIQRAFEIFASGRTMLIAAHRYEMTREADRVLVLIDGRIAQLGTTAELREREGWYRDWALRNTELARAGDQLHSTVADGP